MQTTRFVLFQLRIFFLFSAKYLIDIWMSPPKRWIFCLYSVIFCWYSLKDVSHISMPPKSRRVWAKRPRLVRLQVRFKRRTTFRIAETATRKVNKHWIPQFTDPFLHLIVPYSASAKGRRLNAWAERKVSTLSVHILWGQRLRLIWLLLSIFFNSKFNVQILKL